MDVRWQWSGFDDLDPASWAAVCAAREAVFVVEQDCAYRDLDGLDDAASHLTGWHDGILAVYLRVLPPDTRFAEPSIGRVLTAAPYRGRGLARVAMNLALGHIAGKHPRCDVRISAQAHLENFYRSLGFVRTAPPYDDHGIAHLDMLRPATSR